MSDVGEDGRDDYVRFRVVAYQLAGGDGWCLAETALSLDEFRDSLIRRGKVVTALREIHDGLQRVAPGEEFQASGMSLVFIHTWGWTFDEQANCWRAPGENGLPPSSPSERAEEVRVEFGEPEHSWLPILIAAGQQKIVFRANEIDCPFSRLLGWLERLVDGQYGRVVADLEGSHVEFFSFATGDPSRARIVVSVSGNQAANEPHTMSLDIEIDKRLFARTFYASLRAYAESPLFDFAQWAAIPMHEDLARRGFGTSAAELASFGAAALNAWLWRLYPAYFDGAPAKETTNVAVVQGIERVEGQIVEAPAPHRTPYYEFEIEPEYDGWDFARRVEYLSELLQENINWLEGTDLRKLRSEKLDGMLR